MLAESDKNILLDKIMNYKAVKVDEGKWIKQLKENKL